MAKKMKPLDIVVIVFLIVGGLNWGLVGIANFDLVEFLTGSLTWLARVIYSLVGVSALYSIFSFIKLGRR